MAVKLSFSVVHHLSTNVYSASTNSSTLSFCWLFWDSSASSLRSFTYLAVVERHTFWKCPLREHLQQYLSFAEATSMCPSVSVRE